MAANNMKRTLQEVILNFSVSDNIEIAINEWRCVGSSNLEDDVPDAQCKCKKKHLRTIFQIYNHYTDTFLEPIGSKCIDYFKCDILSNDKNILLNFCTIKKNEIDKYCYFCFKTTRLNELHDNLFNSSELTKNKMINICNSCKNEININTVKNRYILLSQLKSFKWESNIKHIKDVCNHVNYCNSKDDILEYIHEQGELINSINKRNNNKLKFGKYKGETYKDVFDKYNNYCKWVLEKVKDKNKYNIGFIEYLEDIEQYIFNKKNTWNFSFM